MTAQRIGQWLCYAMAGSIGLGLPLPASAQTDWYLLKLSGQPIGEVRIDHYQKQVDRKPTQITEISHINHLVREGTPFEVKAVSRFEESPDSGKALQFSYQYQLNQQPWIDAVGTLENGALNLKMVQNNEPVQGQTVVSADRFFFPDGPALRKIYRQHLHEAPGSQFQFQTMSLGLSPKVVDSQVTLLGLDELKLADGSAEKLHKFEIKNSTRPEQAVYEWRDNTGKLYKAQAVGDAIEMIYASKRQASGVRLSSPNRMTQGIPVDTAIAQPRQVYQALYLLNRKSGSDDWLNRIPQDSGQNIQVGSNASWAKVAVSKIEPADISLTYPIAAGAILQPYLQNSPYIQTRDPQVQALAATLVSGEPRAYAAAQKLRQWVYQNIVNKTYDVGFANAKTTLENRNGDCTEHAVLLAALTRAIGIPSRVATGLLYMPGTQNSGRFVYHMWTEIWLGQAGQGEWLPLDATISEDKPDAARIKLSDSSLRDEEDLNRITQQVTQWMNQLDVSVLQAAAPGQNVLSLSGNVPTLDLSSSGHTVQSFGPNNLQHVDLQRQSNYQVQFADFGPTLQPNAPDTLFTRGVEQLSQGNQDAANMAFQQALQKTTHPLAMYRLGEKLFAVNMTDLAAQAFQQAAQSDSRLRAFSEAWHIFLKSGARDFKSLERQGDQAMQQNQAAKALENYTQAEQQLLAAPNLIKSTWLTTIRNKKKLATGAKLTKANPRNASGWILIGQALQALDNPDEAQKAFQNALRLQPASSDALIGIFDAALTRSDWDTLERYQTSLSKLKNTAASAARLLGLHALKTRRYDQARALLTQARQLAPREARNYLNQVELERMISLYQQNTKQNTSSSAWLKPAENTLRSGLNLATDKHDLRLRLAEILLEQNKASDAGALAEQALSENPLNATAYRLQGMVRLHQNRLDEAQKALESADILEPNNAETWIALGHVAAEKQDDTKAIQCYQQAYRLDPNNEKAVAALRQSGVLGLKSSLKQPLNADEHHYLVQALRLYRKMLLNTLDSLRAVKSKNIPVIALQVTDFSLESLDTMREVNAINEQTLSRSLQIYQQLLAMKPPRRFAQFHHQLELMSYAEIDLNQNIGEARFYSPQEREELTRRKQEKEAALAAQATAFVHAEADMAASLPKSTLAAIRLESRWNEQEAILQEIAALKPPPSSEQTSDNKSSQKQ